MRNERGAPARRLPVRRSAGTSNARNPAKLSELTRPEATSSASASSTCGRNRPVPSTSSSKNEAPCSPDEIGYRLRLRARMEPRRRSPIALPRAGHDAAPESVIGVVRTGVALRSPPFGRVLRGRSRAQAMRPERHWSSSQDGSYSASRAGRISVSQAPAGASKPSSCADQDLDGVRPLHARIRR